MLKVLYFASARSIAERGREEVPFEGSFKVKDLARRLHELHPGLKPLKASTRYAVNQELVDDDQILHDGDEVGVLPAVTGG